MAVGSNRQSTKHAPFHRLLHAKRAELLSHLRERRRTIVAERGPEDEGGLASRSLLEDLAVGTLQREQGLLGEVEAALRRLQEDHYGVCEVCGEEIPARRLQALPWTRFCLACAERRQSHSKN